PEVVVTGALASCCWLWGPPRWAARMSARTASRCCSAETVTRGTSELKLTGEARLARDGELAAKREGKGRIRGAGTNPGTATRARERAAARRTWCCGFECI